MDWWQRDCLGFLIYDRRDVVGGGFRAMQFSLRWPCIPFDEALPPFEQFYVPTHLVCVKRVSDYHKENCSRLHWQRTWLFKLRETFLAASSFSNASWRLLEIFWTQHLNSQLLMSLVTFTLALTLGNKQKMKSESDWTSVNTLALRILISQLSSHGDQIWNPRLQVWTLGDQVDLRSLQTHYIHAVLLHVNPINHVGVNLLWLQTCCWPMWITRLPMVKTHPHHFTEHLFFVTYFDSPPLCALECFHWVLH